MKNLLAKPLLRSRYTLAIIAGLLWAASFPKIGLAALAWVAPALMLAAALGTSGAERFRIGYVAGLAHYLASLHWLLLIPYRWHGVPLGPGAGWIALSAYLALYPAAWVWMVSTSQPSTRGERGAGSGERGAGRALTLHALTLHALTLQALHALRSHPSRWARRTGLAISGAASWVALEMIVGRLFSGFPWNFLGASQYQLTPLIQIASVTGIYGVSFLVVWVSLSLMSAALMVIRRPAHARMCGVGEVILPILAVSVAFGLGYRHLRQDSPADRTLRVTFVQPNVPQTVIWDSTKNQERFQQLIRLSEEGLTNQPALLVWPEAAVPTLVRYDKETFEAVTTLARTHHLWMIVGADDAERRSNAAKPDEVDYFNSSFLISPEGRLVGTYRKQNLVMLGEYVPHWLPFLKYFTPIEGGFTPGNTAVTFELTNLQVKTSVLICFEDVFPHVARQAAREDTDFLVNLTNNGWFGEGAAQWQHAASALFRAIENDLPLLRCSNNGLTCWVDARGRLRQLFQNKEGSVYGAGVMTADIPLLPLGGRRRPTFYHRHGDGFGWGCVGVAAGTLAWRLARRNKFAP